MDIVFETKRLLLRKFTLADAALVYQLNSDPQVITYLHEPLLNNETEAARILQQILLPPYEKKLGRWAIHLKEDSRFIGWCGLKQIPDSIDIDLGYRLMKTAWGKGYATEATSQTLNYAFKTLALPSVLAKVHADNIASIKVLEKIGMNYLGEEKEEGFPIKTYQAFR